ncbi:MAG: UDP-2,4-diacetamido-2,4,6-trideoxy-beta-L-altropyranose hydrolase [Chloroflexota bacterium]|nr:UDP-2,4-diacetamido-2,4,6-trideoxy-beta-L-altropyranose hydrolase [Chloroflexota bacterium]
MRVLFRADASTASGIGHLMRSLALAQALRDVDDEVTLLTAVDLGSLADQWEAEGATVRLIDVEIGSADDAVQTGRMSRELRASWLVLDGYAFDEVYRSALDPGARLLLIDDHGGASLRADLIVNGNLYGGEAMYPQVEGRLLTGPRYAILRREFRAHVTDTRRAGVLLSLGGADPRERTAPLLAALTERGLRGQVVIGPRHPSPDNVRTIAVSAGWEPLDMPDRMAPLLATAAIAIVGSGTTTLECAALGVPMVAVRIADNQMRVASALDKLGLAVVVDAEDVQRAALAAAELAADHARRSAMAEAGPRIVDGQGASRVAGAMRGAMLTVRHATRNDAGSLYEWRNDPTTRASSFSAGEVPWDGHLAWLGHALSDAGTRLLVGELDGAPVGSVRLERKDETATISITVAPEARSRGLAEPLIRAGLSAAEELGVERVYAFIRPENEVSRRAFSAAGFIAAPWEAQGAPSDAIWLVCWLGRRP